MEWSGGGASPEGRYELTWENEPLTTVVARAQAAYPDLDIHVYDVGDRLFLATEPSFAAHTLTLPQTTYPDGMSALSALLDSFRPEGMPVRLSHPLTFHSLDRDPRPISFRSANGSMVDMMDQWLDAYVPGGGRWTLRCNTDMARCTVFVQRFVSTALPDGWMDTSP